MIELTEYKIYEHCIDQSLPRDVLPDFVNLASDLNSRLHRDNEIVKGELVRVTYYADATIENGLVVYSNAVALTTFQYYRDSDGLATKRVELLRWYLGDGSLSESGKTRVKYYRTEQEKKVERRRRNTNIVDYLDGQLKTILGLVPGLDADAESTKFWENYFIDLDKYTASSSKELYNAILSDTLFSWFSMPLGGGVTLRHAALDALNIWDTV